MELIKNRLRFISDYEYDINIKLLDNKEEI